MIFILKLYSSSRHDSIEVGDVKINKKKIISVAYSENYASDNITKPLRENSEYTYSFLEDGDDFSPEYDIKIVSNDRAFYARLNMFKKVKLKIQFKEYWVQKNTLAFFTFLITFISLILLILEYMQKK